MNKDLLTWMKFFTVDNVVIKSKIIFFILFTKF